MIIKKTTEEVLTILEIEDLKNQMRECRDNISLWQFLIDHRDWKDSDHRVEIDEFHQNIFKEEDQARMLSRKLQKEEGSNGRN